MSPILVEIHFMSRIEVRKVRHFPRPCTGSPARNIMLQRNVNWPFGKFWIRKSTLRRPIRTRQPRAVAAQIEFLEERAFLSATLGAAGSFAVLGGSGVTNISQSAIHGNV